MVNHDLMIFCTSDISRGLRQRNSKQMIPLARLRHVFARDILGFAADIGKQWEIRMGRVSRCRLCDVANDFDRVVPQCSADLRPVIR